jgi:hypothetical protein
MESEASHPDDVRKFKEKIKDVVAEKLQKKEERLVSTMQARGDLPKRIEQFKSVFKEFGRQGQCDVFNVDPKRDVESKIENEPDLHLKTFLPYFTPVNLEEPEQALTVKDKETAKDREARLTRISGNEGGK